MTALTLNPFDTNYLSCRLINDQMAQNQSIIPPGGGGPLIEVLPIYPVSAITDGTGRVSLQGAFLVNSVSSNFVLGTLPANLKPYQDIYATVAIARGASYVQSTIKIGSTTGGIGGLSVSNAGTYSGVPTITLGSPGTGAVLQAAMGMKTVITVVTPQSGTGSYAPGDIVSVNGGSAPYLPAVALINVTNTQVASAAVNGGGTGGTNGTQTVTGTTGTGTHFQASVTVSGGTITAVLSITVPGNYTVNPTNIINEPVTGAGLTGASLNLKMGVLTATRNAAGNYGGVPANPVAVTPSTGTGTGATFNVQWEVTGAFVISKGQGYSSSTPVTFTGGGVIGGNAAVATLTIDFTNTGNIVFLSTTTVGDIIFLDNVSFLVEPYS